jgi:hypothetical protein
MFNRQTLFVVGSGASAEVGMPIGTQLASKIGKKLDIRFELGGEHIGSGDLELFQHIRSAFRDNAREYQHVGWLIRDGIALSQSIDDFLDLHRANSKMNLYGKAAIVKSILETERSSKLYFDSTGGVERFDASRVADTWLVKFMHMLGRGIPKETAREIFDHVSFIIFNYDRCIEYFLLHSLQKLYGMPEEEASSILDDLRIIHPYGLVSELRSRMCPDGLPFGCTDGLNLDYVSLAGNIKTYTEQVAAADLLSNIEAEMRKAECLVFLGFAYHSQNMQLLKPGRAMPHKPVFGTAYKMSSADTDVVSHQISQFFTPNMTTQMRADLIRLENKLTSADLFDNYAKSLTGGD